MLISFFNPSDLIAHGGDINQSDSFMYAEGVCGGGMWGAMWRGYTEGVCRGVCGGVHEGCTWGVYAERVWGGVHIKVC